MQKKIWFLIIAIAMSCSYTIAAALEYHQVYKPKAGMTADEVMEIKYFNKYSLFANDYQSVGDVVFIEKDGSKRNRRFLRQRIILGRSSDNVSYKDLVMFTAPTSVKGLATLTWNYMNPNRDQDVWLWLPSLRKIRKVSAGQADDSFMGGDLTVEEITSRRFTDETYKLIGEENFKGYTSVYDGKVFHKDEPCFVIEATPKRKPWYYSKRITYVSKNFGGNMLDEIYDSNGKLYRTLFRGWIIMDVNGKEYPAQNRVEASDLRTGHKTVMLFDEIKFDQGLSEDAFTEKTLMRQRW
ncbi:MAG: outer membrane lipoprotein-sorting protein [Candidatus Omnitrophica bacterium]|nr:outer membrane lipoprotein-sorting protein [Candidatus Omnitrophota bacterium]